MLKVSNRFAHFLHIVFAGTGLLYAYCAFASIFHIKVDKSALYISYTTGSYV